MLQPKIVLQKTGNLITVNEETGAYSLENPGGFGLPNSNRADLRAGLLVDRRSFGERHIVPVLANPEDADASAVDSWFVTLPADGLYDYLYIAAAPFDPAITYGVNAVVFNPNDNFFYKAIHQMLPNTPIEDVRYWMPMVLAEQFPITKPFTVTGAYFALVQKTHTANADNKFLIAALAFGKHSCNCEGLGDQAKDYAKLLMYRYSIHLNEAIRPPDYKAAGRAIDHINEMLDRLKDDCEC